MVQGVSNMWMNCSERPLRYPAINDRIKIVTQTGPALYQRQRR